MGEITKWADLIPKILMRKISTISIKWTNATKMNSHLFPKRRQRNWKHNFTRLKCDSLLTTLNLIVTLTLLQVLIISPVSSHSDFKQDTQIKSSQLPNLAKNQKHLINQDSSINVANKLNLNYLKSCKDDECSNSYYWNPLQNLPNKFFKSLGLGNYNYNTETQLSINCANTNGNCENETKSKLKVKRSIPEKVGPLRVFKYITDYSSSDISQNEIQIEPIPAGEFKNSGGTNDYQSGKNGKNTETHQKNNDIEGITKNEKTGKNSSSGNNGKNAKHRSKNGKNVFKDTLSKKWTQTHESETESVEKPQGVNDRSLIRNSFFASEPTNPSLQATTTATTHTPITEKAHNTHKEQQNQMHNNHYYQNANQISNDEPTSMPTKQNHLHHLQHHHQTHINNNSTLLDLPSDLKSDTSQSPTFNLSLSEFSDRSRRSPYRNLQLIPPRQNPQRFHSMPNQNQIQNANRAALYLRRNNEQKKLARNPQQQLLMQNQIRLGIPQQMQMRNINNNNNNSPRRNSVQKVPQKRNPSRENLLLVPSSSNTNFLSYPQQMRVSQTQNPPPLTIEFPYGNQAIPEPTWNSPVYRRYSNAAKSVRNTIHGNKNPNQQQAKRRDNRPPDFSKLPPIPLPRPRRPPRPPSKNKPRRPSRNKGAPRPPRGYSYPKSAQNIQDILNHFQSDNNEILDSLAKSSRHPASGSSSLRSSSLRSSSSGGGGNPHAISDLSSELKDVRYSLMRDIREFAKRPNNLGEPEDEEIPVLRSPRPKPLPLPDYAPKRKKNSSSRPFYSDVDRFEKKSHRNYNTEEDRETDPHSPHYNHEEGFDEIFNPKPKPVRDMIKASSRFRQSSQAEEDEEEYHSKKRDRPLRRDRERDQEPYRSSKPYSSSKRSKYEHESRERYESERRRVPQDSSDRYKNDRPSRHPSDEDLYNPRPKYTPTSKGHLEESFDSFEGGRYPAEYYSKREKEILRDREFPKSIRDKIRETSSHEFNSNPKLNNNNQYRPPQASQIDEGKPIVLKRPYEPYRIPPEELIPKRTEGNEFWNNYASATEKAFYGYPNNFPNGKPTAILRPTNVHLLQGPPYSNIVQNPYQQSQVLQNPNQIGVGLPILSTHDEEEDVLEIIPHGPPYSNVNSNQQNFRVNQHPSQVEHAHLNAEQKQLQKAYLELLQHKMQMESALLSPPGPLQSQIQQSSPQQTSASSGIGAKGKKAAMRMKIHIYPNDEASGGENDNLDVQNTYPSNYPNLNLQRNNYQNSKPSIPLTRQHQQKVGGSLRAPQNSYGGNSDNGGRDSGSSASGGKEHQSQGIATSVDKNKNLVLHLHVHRRNDMGPVELIETEESQHVTVTSTAKPLNYKDIFDEQLLQQQSQNQHQLHHHEDEEDEEAADEDQHHQHHTEHQDHSISPSRAPTLEEGGGGDKSVSMEVPIHDDKIGDVLHTLLQFRDRGNGSDRKKRNHPQSNNNMQSSTSSTTSQNNPKTTTPIPK